MKPYVGRQVIRSLGVIGVAARRHEGWWLVSAAWALAYVAGAYLGPLASVGSGGASVIWPASGVALAGLMIAGWRVLPGLFAAAVFMNGWYYLLPRMADPMGVALGSLGISLASVLQAALAARLLRELPTRLAAAPVRQTLRFVGWVLLACLLGVLASAATRWGIGLLKPQRLVDSVAAWWLGDAAGMLVVAPPLLVWLHPQMRRQPVGALAFPILCIGIGLTLIASYMLAHFERRSEREQFRAAVEAFALTLQGNLDLAARDLEVLRAQFYKVALDQAEFATTTRPLLGRAPWSLSYAWLPRVTAAQRRAFEAEMSGSRATPLAIRAEEGAVAPAPDEGVELEGGAPVAYPRLWIEPAAGYEGFVGVDDAADALRAPALRQAAQDPEVVATVPKWVETPGTLRRLVVQLYARVDPVPRAGSDLRELAAAPPRGLVSAAIDLPTLIQAALRSVEGQQWRWLLFDPLADEWAGMTWDGASVQPWSMRERPQQVQELSIGIHERRDLYIGGRNWTLLAQPESGGQRPWWRLMQPVALVVGLGFTGLLAGYLVTRQRRELEMRTARDELERQVAERTRDLADANTQLHQEVDVRRRAERELLIFRWFTESADQGMGIATFDRQVVYMNPQLRRAVRDPDWQPGQARDFVTAYYPPAAQRRMLEVVLPTLLKEGRWSGEVEVKAPGGGRRWVEENYFVLRDDAGEPLHVASILTDITAKRELEQRLREASERADAANQAKSLFLANMSHEIRTPLNAVIGYTQLLLEDQRLDANTRARLATILGASQRLLRLINDVLDLSKIEAGALQLRSEAFDLRRELEELQALMAPRAQAQGLVLQCELDLSAGELVQGDRSKVGQIVLNLLGNAVKFAERGRIVLRAWRDADRLCAEVCDEGPGIAEQEQQEIFSAFRQGQSGQEKGGTGLGLALARRYAEAMGGSLTLRSRLGEGTCVYVQLPLPVIVPGSSGGDEAAHAAEAAALVQDIESLDPATPRRVLVVDDDPDSRDVLCQALQGIGCDVTAAADGLEALQACAGHPFDIVFADIRMPRLDGLTMLQRLREVPATRNLPVVAVSASSLEHERRHYVEQGFQDFIGKPYVFAQLFAALAQHSGAKFLRRSHPAPRSGEGEVEPAASGDPVWAASARADLQALSAAAAAGDLAGVSAALERLTPPNTAPVFHRSLQQAAQTYDFESLEALAEQALRRAPAGAGDAAITAPAAAGPSEPAGGTP